MADRDSKTAASRAMEDDLLAVADSKLVLGNWYAECVINGRSLPDYAALLGMCNANYGHVRALYQYLAGCGHSYATLERGRGPDDIRSMNLLDRAPRSWEDFLVSVWLAEQATWLMMSGFLNSPDRTVAGLARKIGQETYFHLKYVDGWVRVLGAGDAQRESFRESFAHRFPLALAWFGAAGDDDPLHAAGLRDTPLAAIRAAFVAQAESRSGLLGADLPWQPPQVDAAGWRRAARRHGPLPAGLFEVIRFKDAELAH
ncbi:Phenylacetic acid catabolic protein [Azospirillum sp. ST 5-10]|uniref:Phenylacetic acid catabolic protein n=1 Tax=unclassified Azospirillum TaxID=2630922 RepID=UPI003F49C5BB